jgi:enoyl-[acyl-carrier protein] reductase I
VVGRLYLDAAGWVGSREFCVFSGFVVTSDQSADTYMGEQDGHGLLKGKRGIVFGALDQSSIGWHIALAAHREGASLALSNVAVALRFGMLDELSRLCGDAPVLPCDATDVDELNELFASIRAEHGPIDFIVHSIGMSQNIRKGRAYREVNYDWYLRTLDISAVSLHKMITAALDNDAISDGASIVAMSYIAAQRNYSTYSDMGDAKALLESIVRSYGSRLATRGIRINTVSQSPTRTKAGSGIENFDKMFEFADRTSPLGNATAAECADYVVTLLSDLTRKVTMQNLYHDGGYSSIGTTLPMLRLFHEALQNKELVDNAGFDHLEMD